MGIAQGDDAWWFSRALYRLASGVSMALFSALRLCEFPRAAHACFDWERFASLRADCRLGIGAEHASGRWCRGWFVFQSFRLDFCWLIPGLAAAGAVRLRRRHGRRLFALAEFSAPSGVGGDWSVALVSVSWIVFFHKIKRCGRFGSWRRVLFLGESPRRFVVWAVLTGF